MPKKKQLPHAQVLSDRKLDPSMQALTLADVRRPGAPLVYVNHGFEKMTGYTRAEALGRNCKFLQGPASSPEFRAQMAQAISQGNSLIIDVLNYRKDGSGFWNRLSLAPVKDESGETSHYIGIQSDISIMKVLQDRLHEIVLRLPPTGTQPSDLTLGAAEAAKHND